MNTLIEEEFQTGMNYHQNGNFLEAEIKYKNVLSKNANHFDSLHLLGVLNSQKGNYDVATYFIKKAISLNNLNPMAYNNLAINFLAIKNYKEALEYIDKALSLDNNYVEAFNTKGKILIELGEYDHAEKCFKKLIKLNPSFFEAFFNLGVLSAKLNKFDLSIGYYHKTIELNPEFVNAYYNLGNIYLGLNENEKAEKNYIKALELDPQNSQVYNNLGQIYIDLNKIEEAQTCFEYAIKYNSDEKKAYHNLMELHLKTSNWSEIENYINTYNKKETFNDQGLPGNIQCIMDRPDYLKYVNEKFLSYSCNIKNTYLNFDKQNMLRSKIKIAYFSADYSDNNPVAYLLTDLIKFHNREKFEVFGCSLRGIKDKDRTRIYYEKHFDHFLNFENLSNIEIRELCLSHKFDVVIDLNGYTKYSRPEIFSTKLAPIQVNFLGYPGTLGSKEYDYIIADKIVIPKVYQQYYTEKIAYLPNTYFVNPNERKISRKEFTRKNMKLPSKGIVFCCFNQNYKILPNVYNIWMNILKRVDGSVLLLSNTNKLAKNNLKSEATKRNVDPDRIIFGEYFTDIGDHLERYKVTDIFLDTMPYNAHTTASDALWAGVPLVTCIGKSFASRVSSSILKSVGLEELITHSLKEYEEKAVNLAFSPNKLKDFKLKLFNQRSTSSLFNSKIYTKNIEKAYEMMCQNFCSGNRSKTFEI